jgi:tetratricopeptide (TPR) repeat protein
MKPYLLFVLFCVSTKTFACLNLYVVNEDGRAGVYEDYPPFRIIMSVERDLNSLKMYEGFIKEGKSGHNYISNYAVYLIKLGRHKEALSIFTKLVSKHPKEYELLANLATAYELNGKLDSAYEYMKLSLQINPSSHKNSEWFHLRFLEAALKAKDKGSKVESLNILKLDTETAQSVGYEISHQLKERLPLTSAPNPLLSKAVEETADFYKKNISIDWSIKLYAIAIGYSDNETTRKNLWDKINAARSKVVTLNRSKKSSDQTRKDLMKKNWQQILEQDIANWKNHRAHYETNLTILNL